jgi:hypothetical protein
MRSGMKISLVRATIPVSERRKLLSYYGSKTCVVSGDANNVDWHHLDDNPSRSTFENLVPLARDLNLRLAQYARDAISTRGIALDPLLSPVGLTITAERHLLLGHPHLAVGASRVASFVMQLYLACGLEAAVSGAARALHYVRHAFDERMVMDILLRNVLQPMERSPGRIGVNTKVDLCMELGALLQDAGEIMKSSEILDHALLLVPSRGATVPPSSFFELLWRRSRAFSEMNNPTRADEFLERGGDWKDGTARQEAHVSRIRAANHMRVENWGGALDVLEGLRADLLTRAGEPRAYSSTYWATASVLIDSATVALHAHGRRHFEAVTTSLEDAARLLQDSRGGISSWRLRGIQDAARAAPPSITTAVERLPRIERRASEALTRVIAMVIAKLGG